MRCSWRGALALGLMPLAALVAGSCGGSGGTATAPPTAPPPATETVTVTYWNAADGSPIAGTVTYTDGSGNQATAETGSTITILQRSRFSIEAPGFSRKESDARGQVDGVYWGIPAALQAALDRARGDGALRRPALDRAFDVVIDRLTFPENQRQTILGILEATAPVVTAGRYRWTYGSADDPGPRSGTYAVVLSGTGSFTPFPSAGEIQGGRVGIDPTGTAAELEAQVRLAAAWMVGFRAETFDDNPRTYLAMTRLPIGNRAPNTDP